MAIPGVKCPQCGSTRLWRIGPTITKIHGKRFRAKCQECATSFYLPKPKVAKAKKNGKKG